MLFQSILIGCWLSLFLTDKDREDGEQVLGHMIYRCVNMQYCVQNNDKLTYDNKSFISNIRVSVFKNTAAFLMTHSRDTSKQTELRINHFSLVCSGELIFKPEADSEEAAANINISCDIKCHPWRLRFRTTSYVILQNK